MTYGTIAATLRRELAALLDDAEVPKTRPGARPLTAEQRQLVQGYRMHVLDWGNRATQIVVPEQVSRRDARWGPARNFADQLARAAEGTRAVTVPIAPLDLGQVQESKTVEGWRRAAVAAAVAVDLELSSFDPVGPVADPKRERRELLAGDMDAGAVAGTTPLGPEDYLDRLRVVDDDAALANALILLDVRVSGRPGWHHLGGTKGPGPRRSVGAEGLLNAVELCRRWTRAHVLSSRIDERGHQPAPEVVPVAPGMPGVIAPLRNTLTQLERNPPSGDAMRLLIRSQAGITVALLREATLDADATASRLGERRAFYATMLGASANLGGRIGTSAALVESEQARAILASRVRPSTEELRQATELVGAIDSRIGHRILEGADDATYVVATGKHLAAAQTAGSGVRRATTKWSRVELWTAGDLLTAAAAAARSPVSAAQLLPSSAGEPARADFDATLRASTPARTAATSPLLRAPVRETLSGPDMNAIRRASFPSAAVEAVTHDYLLRRPKHRGGINTSKGAGEPSPER